MQKIRRALGILRNEQVTPNFWRGNCAVFLTYYMGNFVERLADVGRQDGERVDNYFMTKRYDIPFVNIILPITA